MRRIIGARKHRKAEANTDTAKGDPTDGKVLVTLGGSVEGASFSLNGEGDKCFAIPPLQLASPMCVDSWSHLLTAIPSLF